MDSRLRGKEPDFVVEGGQARLSVECYGDEYHGVDQYEQDMQHQLMLERCGWVFFRVRASHFNADKQTALENLWGILDERGIFPQTRKDSTEDKEPPVIDQQSQTLESITDIGIDIGDTMVYVDVENPETEKQALITRDRYNPEWGTINVNTPLAQALLGARVGDTVEANLPRGLFRYHINQIRKLTPSN